MKSYVKFAWIGHMDWINYKYVNVETALNQYQLVRNICHKCDQPYAALNGSSWVVQKSTACNFLYSSNKNSNETLLTAVASWIHWKFEFFIFLPARRSPSEILLFQFNFVDAETQSLPTHKKNRFASSLIAIRGPNGIFNGIDFISLRIDCDDEGGVGATKKPHSLRNHIFVNL